MKNLSNSIKLINSNHAINVKNNQICKVSFKKAFSTCLNRRAKQKRDDKIIEHVKNILKEMSVNSPVEERVQSFQLAEGAISRYKKNTKNKNGILELDNLIVKKRLEIWPKKNIEIDKFQTEVNQKNLSRWIKYGYSEKIFVEHFEFSNFLIKSRIASAMATWGDNVEGPQLLVDGKLVHWDKIKDSLEIKYHPESRIDRVYDKKSGAPLEYLGGGKGLVHCDRYGSNPLPIVTKIQPQEVEYLQNLAQKYKRPNDKDQIEKSSRNYVLQVVSNERKTGSNNFAQTFQKANHPYLRLISPEGDVKIVGFMLFNNHLNPLKHGRGSLDSPDFGEFCYSGTHYITNIAIDQSEAEKFESVCLDLMKDEDLTFNFRAQNCTSFVKYMLQELKLADLPEAPTATKVAGNLIFGDKKAKVLKSNTKKSKSRILNTMLKILSIAKNIFLKLFVLAIGDRPFNKFGQKANPKDTRFTRFFKWLIEPITIDYPLQIQNWQKEVVSTEKVNITKRAVFSSRSIESKT